jgi:energy-coupling factor transporter ATP-binding protein EcfA2
MRPRDNPFASHRVESIDYDFLTGSREKLVTCAESPGCRGAIVGPKGHGKTTLLEKLDTVLRKRGHTVRLMRLCESRPRLQTPPARPGEILLLDGAEQLRSLGWPAFRWRMRRARALVITTHREGRLPTLHRCETTPALLASLVTRLLGDGANVDEDKMLKLFARHRGDIRQALRELYDAYANSRSTGMLYRS